MKTLKFSLLLTVAALVFGFAPTTASAQYRGGHYDRCETVVRYYDHHDGWRYQVVRYYDHHCGTWRERHVRVSRCQPRYQDHHHRSYHRAPVYDSRRSHYRGRQVQIGGIRFTVDGRRGISRGCR